jgi:hypothetical protein
MVFLWLGLAFFWVLILFLWISQFVDLMSMSDSDFPGRYDKALWVVSFIVFFFLLAPLAFIFWKQRQRDRRAFDKELDDWKRERGERQRNSNPVAPGSSSPYIVAEKPPREPTVEDLFSQASSLDAAGEWAKALAIYDALANRLAGEQDGEYARNRAKEIRAKMAQVSGN